LNTRVNRRYQWMLKENLSMLNDFEKSKDNLILKDELNNFMKLFYIFL
jgi:hypothetical protein